MSGDLELITAAALKAGDHALKLRRAGEVRSWAKSGGSPVTNVDLEVNGMLEHALTTARPDYGWLSEETVDDSSRLEAGRVFVVDPIDGTIAFIKDRPWWAVSVAVVEAGEPVAGVLYAPAVGELYQAAWGSGARMNGEAIRVSDRADLEGCAMLADAEMLRHPRWPRPWPEDMRIERRNSVAYRMAQVAAGAFDATLALSAKCDWDLAAADLIVREAGGLSSDHTGQPFAYNRASASKRSLVCAGPELHRLILERLGHIELSQ